MNAKSFINCFLSTTAPFSIEYRLAVLSLHSIAEMDQLGLVIYDILSKTVQALYAVTKILFIFFSKRSSQHKKKLALYRVKYKYTRRVVT